MLKKTNISNDYLGTTFYWGTWTNKNTEMFNDLLFGYKGGLLPKDLPSQKSKPQCPCAQAPAPAVQLLTCFKFTCPGIMATTTPMATFWLSSWRRKDPNLEPELPTMCVCFLGKKLDLEPTNLHQIKKGLVINWMMMIPNSNPLQCRNGCWKPFPSF